MELPESAQIGAAENLRRQFVRDRLVRDEHAHEQRSDHRIRDESGVGVRSQRVDQRFAREFLRKTGVCALIGYTTRVDWMSSLVADMLFLHRFYRDPSPWRNLRRIFASVQRDYPCARRLGYMLVTTDRRA